MDAEAEENLADIFELLASAGYFRSRIQGLNPFDKVVGGMVWCISLCARNVDVDLLYSENSTIGRKISLTEKIVQVLPELKCPYSLEPHQIQGLDAAHILPVIQWLVKEANIVRELLGDETLNFAVYEFDQQGWTFSDKLEKVGNAGVLPLVSRKVYRRVMRMALPTEEEEGKEGEKDETKQPKQSKQLTAGTSNKMKPTNSKVAEEEEDLIVVQAMDPKGGLVFTAERRGGGEGIQQQQQTGPAKRDQLRTELESLQLEEDQLDTEMEAMKGKAAELEEQRQSREEMANQYQKATQSTPKETVELLRTLLAQRDELKAAESAFKAQCREELTRLDQQIEAADGNGNAEAAGQTPMIGSKDELQHAQLKFQHLYGELTALNQQIVRLARKVGAKPSQAEMSQYQMRFVELCNQMVSKHRETKRQYTLHNTLVDVRNFTRKEIDLLDSIDRQKELALRPEYADSLLENLQKIAKGVDESLDKKLGQKRLLQEQRDQLQEQLQTLLDKQRLYTKTVVDFQQECQRNEQLRQSVMGLDGQQ